MFAKTLAFTVCAVLLALEHKKVESIDFDRNYFGVHFSPYVKNAYKNGTNPGSWTYTIDNLKTLMEVTSTKFSKLKTCCVGKQDGFPYVENSTYYSKANIIARTAEAAALVNREKNNKTLTVLIGVYNKDWRDSQAWETSLHVAAEAAKIANKIYPGTVEGIYTYRSDTSNISWANLTLAGVTKLRSLTAGLRLSIGTQQSCHDLSPNQSSDSRSVWAVRKQIILASDFIICFHRPQENDIKFGVESVFSNISRDLREGLVNVKRIHPSIMIMWSTFWPNVVNDTSLASIRNFKNYWEKVNDFVTEHRIRAYVGSAFDSTTHLYPNLGWWRLTNNSLINNPSGYLERVSVLSSPKPTSARVRLFTPAPRFVGAVLSYPKNELATLKPMPNPSNLKTDDTNGNNGFAYGFVTGVIGVFLVGGIIFVCMKLMVHIMPRNTRSPKYTGNRYCSCATQSLRMYCTFKPNKFQCPLQGCRN